MSGVLSECFEAREVAVVMLVEGYLFNKLSCGHTLKLRLQFCYLVEGESLYRSCLLYSC